MRARVSMLEDADSPRALPADLCEETDPVIGADSESVGYVLPASTLGQEAFEPACRFSLVIWPTLDG